MTLVEETQKRVASELPKERTLLLLNRLHEPHYVNILNDTPTGNLIEQPCNIGTAPAILYSVLKDCRGGSSGHHRILSLRPLCVGQHEIHGSYSERV
jgi:hypothetical protein